MKNKVKEKPELWDIYNKNVQKTGKIIRRGEKLSSGEYHLVVHIWPNAKNGSFLIVSLAIKI